MARKPSYLLPEMRAQTSASTAGNGTAFNLGGGFSKFSLEVVKTATTRPCLVQLQGSLSGGSSSWKTLSSWASSGGKVTGDIINFSSGAYTRVRASVVTVSSSETVSVWIAASH